MLSDRQAVILRLMTASIEAGILNPYFMAKSIDKNSGEFSTDIEVFGKIADALLRQTASPFNAVSISAHLEKNTAAMLEIANTLKEISQPSEDKNGLPHEMS